MSEFTSPHFTTLNPTLIASLPHLTTSHPSTSHFPSPHNTLPHFTYSPPPTSPHIIPSSPPTLHLQTLHLFLTSSSAQNTSPHPHLLLTSHHHTSPPVACIHPQICLKFGASTPPNICYLLTYLFVTLSTNKLYCNS